MKTIVSDQQIHEEEIKPSAESAEFRRLLQDDYEKFLASGVELHASLCPGCGDGAHSLAFTKSGQNYVECSACLSVYATPRPTLAATEDFYRHSAAIAYWRESLLPASRDARRAKIFRPQVEWLLDTLDRHHPSASGALAVGYHSDLLIEELISSRTIPFPLTVTNPLADLKFSRAGFESVKIVPTSDDELHRFGPIDIILAFDVMDRSADLDRLFATYRRTLGERGLLLSTSTLISGLDLQTLWDQSESIYPPDRMNLLSVEGVTALSERHGFEILEFSTPGVFDVEIVQHAIKAHPDLAWPRFLKYLLASRDENTRQALQEYLQKFRLSSFARLVLRKR